MINEEPRVLGLRADKSGCGFYRIEQPLRQLRMSGTKVWIDDFPEDVDSANIIVCQRTHRKNVIEFVKNIQQARELYGRNVKIVYELDDDLWNISDDNPASGYYRRKDVQDGITEMMGLIDAATVSTNHLASVIGEYTSAPVFIIPNHVPNRLFNLLDLKGEVRSKRGLTLLWSGSNTHEEDISVCVSSVTEYLIGNQHSSLIFVGTDYSHLFPDNVRRQITYVGGRKTVGEYHSFLASLAGDVDVVLAPLAVNEFNRSKSEIRLLEAGALGIPVIATEFGPYGPSTFPEALFVQPGGDWVEPLKALESAKLRFTMTQRSKQWVHDNRRASLLPDLYREVYSSILSLPL